MKVTKDIDIKNLKEVFKRQIDLAINKEYANVNINFVMALRILYVLEETQIREERHQTLESACTFMEMEDGTQTNELEYYNNTTTGKENQLALEKMLGKLGHIMGNECYECPKAYENITKAFEENKEKNKEIEERGKKMELHEKMAKMLEHLQKANGIIPVCFGNYEYDKNMDKCFKCEYTKECAKSSDAVPDCYGCYDDKDLDCNNCKSKEYCVEDTEKRKEEDDDFI